MYHTLIIVGNVGKDPEMRYTPSGQAVTSFSVASNRQYTTGNGEQVKETIWFRVTTWGKQAEVCNQYVKKGMKVLVEGRLTPDKATGGPRVWTKQDGSAGASFEVTANTVRFLSARGEGEGVGMPISTGMDAAEIPEDRAVLLPVIVNMDGFILSHVIEPLEMIEQEKIDRFLPPYKPLHSLHPDKPVTMGAFALPSIFAETKKAQEVALLSSMPKILETWKAFGDMTGRYYSPVETYKAEDAENLLITMGSCGETASVAVDKLREEGRSVGLVKIRLWRPFPFDELKKATLGAKQLVVIDRAISIGGPGGPPCFYPP